MDCRYIQFNEDIQFFNEQGINDFTIEAYKDYIAFRIGNKYKIKTSTEEFFIDINSKSLCAEYRIYVN